MGRNYSRWKVLLPLADLFVFSDAKAWPQVDVATNALARVYDCPCTSITKTKEFPATIHQVRTQTDTVVSYTTVEENGSTVSVRPTTTSALRTYTTTRYQQDTAFSDITLDRTVTATTTVLNVTVVFGNETRFITTPTTLTESFTRTLNQTLTSYFNATSTANPLTTTTLDPATVTVLPPADRVGAYDPSGASGTLTTPPEPPPSTLVPGQSWSSDARVCIVRTSIDSRFGNFSTVDPGRIKCPCAIRSSTLYLYTTVTAQTTSTETQTVRSGTLLIEDTTVTVTSSVSLTTTAHSTTVQDRLHYDTSTTTASVTSSMTRQTTTAVYSTVPSTSVYNTTLVVTANFNTNVTSTMVTTGKPSVITVTPDPVTVTGTRCTPKTAVPSQALAHPTALLGVAGGNMPSNRDDGVLNQLELPFPITFYGSTTSIVTPSPNGWILFGTTTYDSLEGPTDGMPDFSTTRCDPENSDDPYCMPQGPFIAVFWTDLYYAINTPQGIFYETAGDVGSRNLTFEFYASHYRSRTAYYHFLMTFYEDQPNVVTYSYLDVSDSGEQATVGTQCETCAPGGIFSQYSHEESVITPGLQIEFDPLLNKFVSTSGGCVADVATSDGGSDGGFGGDGSN